MQTSQEKRSVSSKTQWLKASKLKQRERDWNHKAGHEGAQDSFTWPNINIVRVPKEKREGEATGKIPEEVAENNPNLMRLLC